jgi:transcription initiation factor TFIIA large subunit
MKLEPKHPYVPQHDGPTEDTEDEEDEEEDAARLLHTMLTSRLGGVRPSGTDAKGAAGESMTADVASGSGRAGAGKQSSRRSGGKPARRTIPQHDGPAGGGDAAAAGGDDEAGGAAGAEAAGDGDENDEVLSEDSEPEEEEEDISNFLCCQFEKVTRVKNKWKISMRDGVFHINGKDHLFKKATGEWSWV